MISRTVGLTIALLLAIFVTHRVTRKATLSDKKLDTVSMGCSCEFCLALDRRTQDIPIPYDVKDNADPCTQKPNQEDIATVLAFASRPVCEQKTLSGKCETREYIYQTLTESRRRILKMFTQLALDELNHRSYVFFLKMSRNSTCERKVYKPFFFAFVEFISAVCSVDKNGNSRWRVDIMVEELQLHISQRITLDFTLLLKRSNNKHPLTCTEFTNFPIPRYFIGYPAEEQMIPLPTQVIVTSGEVLSSAGKDPDWPQLDALYLNTVWTKNSDLALGVNLPETLFCSTSPASNDTSLPSSAYPKKRITPPDIVFPEKKYADAIEKCGLKSNTDIQNNYLKPCGYQHTGDPENSYHLQGSSQTYAQSMRPPTWPNGYIEPAKFRNKWPRLWSEPRDRYAWPSAPIGHYWDNLGIRYPKAAVSAIHPGVRSSTQQEPRTPQYWPTITGLPHNAGPNYWLFSNFRGGQATDASKFPTR